MYTLKDAVFNELHFDRKSQAPNFNFRSPSHACRVKKGVIISPRHSTNPVMIPQLDKLAPKNVYVLRDGFPHVVSSIISVHCFRVKVVPLISDEMSLSNFCEFVDPRYVL